MDIISLRKLHQKCCQLVIEKQLSEAFNVLQQLTAESKNSDLTNQLDTYRETYRNMLAYSFGEFEDPEKTKIYHHLLRNVIELADLTLNMIYNDKLTLTNSSLKINQEVFFSKLENPVHIIESLAWENEIGSLEKNPESGKGKLIEHNLKLKQLFHHLWLTNKYTDFETELVSQIIENSLLKWWEKSLIISAVTLSLQKNFGEAKLELLIKAYNQSEYQVWQRALIGILITLYQYNNRLFLYPNIKNLVHQLKHPKQVEKQVELILIQFIKAKDTEKIAQKFRDEIIPEMAKIQSRISEKLDLKNLVQDPIAEDKNPDWEHVFQDSPNLLNKLEELSMLQMEGSDVFMGTFAMLKNFDFFNETSNWFLPFYKENPILTEILGNDPGDFDIKKYAENMESSSIMCNSDKYSFSFNIQYMPVKERTLMVEMFNMEAKAMEEIAADDELLKKPSHERIVFTQYIQDLYRFHKLFKSQFEFYDIFSTSTDFQNTSFINWFIVSDEILRNVGEFYFEKEHYNDAIDIFKQLDKKEGNFELWQKIAYSWQKLGDYQKALEFYLKADLTDIRKPWNIKKIALCYRRLGNYDKALEYYMEAEKLEPENLQVQANMAHTYLDLKDYDKALKKYFKVEYLAPDNKKIQRPIAWCSFMQGKFETAKKYFEKILPMEGNHHDLLNLGHIEWCVGNKKQAIKRYKESFEKSGNNKNWFNQEFLEDSEILIRNGIDPIDIPLMRDLVVYN